MATTYARRAKEMTRSYSWPVQRRRYQQVVNRLLNSGVAVDGSLSEPLARTDSQDDRSLSVDVSPSPDASTLALWDELVQNLPGSDVAQLSVWAEVRRAADFEPLYLFARRDSELLGGALIMTRRLPLIGDVGYVPYGPVIAPDADRDVIIAAIAAALGRLAHRRMKMLFVQPPLDGEDISLELQRQGFRASHPEVEIAPSASLRLDLTRDEDELWAGLPKEARRRARSWPKQGVQVRRGTHEHVALLAELHAASARHQGFEPIPLDYLTTLYARLAPAGHAELFIGEINGKPVAVDLLTGCGGVLKGRLTGMDRDSEAPRLRVTAAVRWEAIRWAKANGYHWFDFGGIRRSAVAILENNSSDSSALTSSEAFKASFGGTPFRYPAPVEIISSPLVRAAYDLSFRWPAARHLVERTSHRLRAGSPLSIPRYSGTATTPPAQ